MIKRMLFMLVLVGIVLGGLFAFEFWRDSMIKKMMSSFGAMPQTVSTTKATTQEWQSQLKAVGSLRAVNGADLACEVAGIVTTIGFTSGDDVQEGAVLLNLRADDDLAKLHALQAAAGLAAMTYQRDLEQLKAQAVSQAGVDIDAANLASARAQVEQQQAIVDKKTLRAPFAGHLGIRAVDRGQYLNAGMTVVTLQALDPIYVDFALPQQALAQIKVGQPVTATIDTYPDQRFTGDIAAINAKVDPATRNVQIRATLKNPEHRLLPSMYASVTIASGAPERFITLPQTAITFNAFGNTVYLVDDKGVDAKGQAQLVVRQIFVTTGATRGDQIALISGVKDGDTVVTSGQIKLHNGSPIVVNNALAPSDDPNPTPPKDQ